MPKGLEDVSRQVDMAFPMRGVDVSLSYQRQSRGTTPYARNVRYFDSEFDRGRGGTRPGITKYINATAGSSDPVQLIDHTVMPGAFYSSTELDFRAIYGLSVAGGNVRYFTPTAYATPTNGDAALASDALTIQGVQAGGGYYFADGKNDKVYSIALTTVSTWTATAGSLPGSAGTRCRLITLWRDRIVLSGLIDDPRNWFMTAVGEYSNFDYAPATPLATQAVSGTAGGLVGDVITGLIPYSKDILIFLCDHSIHRMVGDPMDGGTIEEISSTIGGAFGKAWCKSPEGTVYFFSNSGTVMALAPDSMPISISQQIHGEIRNTDPNANIITMEWNNRSRTVHLFITPIDGSAAVHWVWDHRLHAWFSDSYGNNNYNPFAIHTLDGDDANDRVLLIGGQDGYIRYVNESATKDDAKDIESEVWLGPLTSQELDNLMIKDIIANLTEGSGNVNWSIHTGNTPEEAYAASAFRSGTWTSGRNPTVPIRCAGHAMFLKLSSSNTWAMEAITARVLAKGGHVGRRKY